MHALPRAEHRFGEAAALAPRAPSATAALQFAVMRGISCARVNSARSRSPAMQLDRLDQRASVAALAARQPDQRAFRLVDRDRADAVDRDRRAHSRRCWARKRIDLGLRRGRLTVPAWRGAAHGVTGAASRPPQRAAGVFERREQRVDRPDRRGDPRSAGRHAPRWCGRVRTQRRPRCSVTPNATWARYIALCRANAT